MAKYFGLCQNPPGSERKLAEALCRLPEPWVVLHGVSWQSLRDGREGDGEADFLVLHPRDGAIVVEVKGGGIELIDGRWTTRTRLGKVKPINNPFEQATASKHTLIRWAKAHGWYGLGFGHTVCFPDLDDVPDLGPAASAALVWTRRDLGNIDKAVARTLGHWNSKTTIVATDFQALLRSLAPTVQVRRRLATASADAEAGILAFTAQQVEVFGGLRSERSALVLGGAGTGKTILATARAHRLASDGFETLLVCYNELLGRRLESDCRDTPRLTAGTFHSLCLHFAREAGNDERPGGDEWWETRAPDLLVEACAESGRSFDAIVVDEAQDFAPSWMTALRCITDRDGARPFYVFADPNQELWKRDWRRDDEWGFEFELRENMRNTRPIADRVNAMIRRPQGTRNAPGLNPIWRDVRDQKRQADEVLEVVEDLVDEGFSPGNLVVLADARIVEKLRRCTVGPYSFGEFGSRGIATESIARFKGLEAEAIVLSLQGIEGAPGTIEAYVGASRARSVLYVVAPPRLKTVLRWT